MPIRTKEPDSGEEAYEIVCDHCGEPQILHPGNTGQFCFDCGKSINHQNLRRDPFDRDLLKTHTSYNRDLQDSDPEAKVCIMYDALLNLTRSMASVAGSVFLACIPTRFCARCAKTANHSWRVCTESVFWFFDAVKSELTFRRDVVCFFSFFCINLFTCRSYGH